MSFSTYSSVPTFQTPVRSYDFPMYESGSRTLGHSEASVGYTPESYMAYDTPIRYPSFEATPFHYGATYPTQVEPCQCIHCETARRQIEMKYQQQNMQPQVPHMYVEEVEPQAPVPDPEPPAAVATSQAEVIPEPIVEEVVEVPAPVVEQQPQEPPAASEDVTPTKRTTGKNIKPTRSAKKRDSPAHYAVTVKCRHKRCDFMSKFAVGAGDFVFVEGDRGEDVGEVVHCERVDPTTAPKTSGSVLRLAKNSEIDAFHLLAEEEEACVKVCRDMVEDLHLPLTVTRAAYQFDRKKLTFFYEATERVDFRALLHNLYQEYRCRIWMERVEAE